MTELELSICEAEHDGVIDIITRDSLLSIISEATSFDPDKIRKIVNRFDFEDDDNFQDQIIKRAQHHMMSNGQIKKWSETYYTSSSDKIVDELKSKKLGTVFTDDGGNMIVYSFTTKKFYFFDHEYDGRENLNNKWSIKKIQSYMKSFL